MGVPLAARRARTSPGVPRVLFVELEDFKLKGVY
jgi:hypothetical protein